LRPRRSTVEGEVNARYADADRERTGRVVAGVARLEVKFIVHARNDDVRVDGVDRETGLVLFVARER
jgi:hypothetical protein